MPELKNTVIGVVVTLIVVGIVLGLGFMVFDEFGTTVTTESTTVYNETLAQTGATDYSVNQWLQHRYNNTNCWSNLAIVQVTNNTAGYVIQPANYTNTWDGRFYNITGTELDVGTSGWNVTYSYKSSNSPACLGISDTKTAINKIPTWLAILVVMTIVGLVLYMVFKVLPGARKSSGGIAEI